ncbi:MAG: redox-sensing transcriptional repressor Rex [Rikenellaceae bacterium]
MFSEKKLPEKTIERLSSYRRAVLGLTSDGLTHIYSHQLAQVLGLTAVQVRRDLMLIGFSSSARRGYDIKKLVRYISAIIDAKSMPRVAFVGMGNLAKAIFHYFNGRDMSSIMIAASFDSDLNKIGTKFNGVECYDIADFEDVIRRERIEIVILSCPSEAALSLQGAIESSQIRGVLNFTSASLKFQRELYVENYDMLTLFEKVVYFSK